MSHKSSIVTVIREAKAVDAASIARVDVDSWRTTYSGIVPREYLNALSYQQRTMLWQSRMSNSTGMWHGWFVYVAEDNKGDVVGFSGGGPEHGGNQTFSGELGFIYLLKSYQRQGIGRQLLATVAIRLKQHGHSAMLVWALAENKNKSFYEALGGRPIAERQINIGGAALSEIAYGWQDLSAFTMMLKSGIASP